MTFDPTSAAATTFAPTTTTAPMTFGGGGGATTFGGNTNQNHTTTNTESQQEGPTSGAGASSTIQVLSSMHQDYVHHVAFDIYGRRMATCSGDRFVRVWDLTDSGEWSLVGEWSAHRGPVSMLSWGHPEFGSLLATCGSDHEAKIWEERATHAAPAFNNTTGAGGGTASPNTTTAGTTTTAASRWTIKAQLTEARRAVSCCEFAPRHWGLKLATGSADGCVRIYEAVDVMNLAQWPLAATLQCFGDGLGVTCLSWSTGRFEPSTLVVGGPHIAIYRYMESARQWNCLFQLPSSSSTPSPYGGGNFGSGGGGDVLDVAWAPNVGRRYHYIASAEGQQLRIAKLSRGGGNDPNQLELESTQTLEVSNAWRCQWNVTGTVLASSGDRGVVQLWKSDFEGNFKCVSKIQGDLTQVA